MMNSTRRWKSFISGTKSLRRRWFSVATVLPEGKVAIVGSGPAAFYCLQSIFRRWPNCTVDMFEKLPVPYGLVRYGVAPDHPEVKNCINQFERTVEENSSRFRFYGNVEVGKDLSIKDLMKAYHVTVLAYGAESDKRLGIKGENARNCFSARAFVGWYNGLPEMVDLPIDLTATDRVVIFGHGNVALDAARVLLLPIDALAKTDVAEHALEALKKSRIKNVALVGRRGPMQISFTIAELREMIKLPGSRPIFQEQDFRNIDAKTIEALPRPRRRLTQLMVDTAAKPPIDAVSAEKSWSLNFLRSPHEILAEATSGFVTGVKVMKNRLSEATENNGFESVKALPTGETEIMPCQLVLFSVGYRTLNIDPSLLPFDAKSHVIETDDPNSSKVRGLPGVYACGWCSKGATGVLATTQLHAKATAERIVADVASATEGDAKPGFVLVESLLIEKKVPWIGWKNWLAIDEIEKRCGQFVGTPRRKILDKKDFFKHASGLEHL